MSILPVLYHDVVDPLSSAWHNFCFGFHPHDMNTVAHPRLNHFASCRRWPRLDEVRDGGSEVVRSNIGKDGFEVCLDVHRFAPNEITVKTVDNSIVVHAKHEERPDEHGYISRQFSRRYELPAGFDVEQVVSQMSSDGFLTIKAPRPEKSLEDSKVRYVPIQQTGQALSIENKDASVAAENDDEKKD